MKKNKVIIPAMALILFSTAASISGTVAWFTASRVFQTTVGNFSVVELDGNLVCTMGAAQGTTLNSTENTINVRNAADMDSQASFTSGAFASKPSPAAENQMYYFTDGLDGTSDAQMGKWNGSAWVDATMENNKVYLDTTKGQYFKATSATAITPVEHNPAVLTHGSFDHVGGHAYVIDGDDTTAFLDRKVDGQTDSKDNWIHKAEVTVNDSSSHPHVVDVYNAVSWTMTFKYNFASDATDVAVYLDTKKSNFEKVTDDPDFKEAASGAGVGFDTAKGFRIGFSEAYYGTPASAGSAATGAHDFVWGNNVPFEALPAAYNTSAGYEVGDIVREEGKVYRCNTAIAASAGTFAPAKWDLMYDLPDFAATTYKAGAKVVHESKVYSRKADGEAASWNAAEWDLLTIPAYANGPYVAGAKVIHDGKVYSRKANGTPDSWNAEEWTFTGDVLINSSYSAYATESVSYSVGQIVKYNGMLYQCNTAIDSNAGAFDSTKWDIYDSSDLRYVNSTTSTKFYDYSDYVYANGGYVRHDNLNTFAGAPERVCILTKAQDTVTVKCSAWFEGTDPNIITDSAMECLKANMVFYSRTIAA